MASINTGKVITGGLLAGVVMNVCDMVWNFTVMQADMTAMAQKFGIDPAVAMSFSGALPDRCRTSAPSPSYLPASR